MLGTQTADPLLTLDPSREQEFAWPEEDLPKRKAERGSSLTADTAAELAKEPMFCFEARCQCSPRAAPCAAINRSLYPAADAQLTGKFCGTVEPRGVRAPLQIPITFAAIKQCHCSELLGLYGDISLQALTHT